MGVLVISALVEEAHASAVLLESAEGSGSSGAGLVTDPPTGRQQI